MKELLSEKDEVIANIEEFNKSAYGTDELQVELAAVTAEISALVKQTEDMIAENAARAQDQAEYQRKYNLLAERYEKKKAEFDNLSNRIDDIRTAAEVTDEFLHILKGLDGAMEEFDVEVWGGMVESVTVHADKSATFLFKNELARITVK